MELKLMPEPNNAIIPRRLNRTFYGIETDLFLARQNVRKCLNRTFYGIETPQRISAESPTLVLIVPFMELKPKGTHINTVKPDGLNRTFYGIETFLLSLKDQERHGS